MPSNSKIKKYNKRKNNINNVNGNVKRRFDVFNDNEDFDDVSDLFPNDDGNHEDQESFLEYCMNH